MPAALALRKVLGSSSSYLTVLAALVPSRNLPLLNSKKGVGSWWQVAYVGGALLGAYLSSGASSTYGGIEG